MSLDDNSLPHSGVIASIEAAAAKVGAEIDSNGVPVKLGRQYRRTQTVSEGYNAEAHTVELTLTSEEPVERWFGTEILSHKKGAIRTTRLSNGISLLFNHDYGQLLGRSIAYKTPDGGPLILTYRFGPSALAQEKEAEVAAEVLKDTSGGYQVYEWDITEDKNGVRTYEGVDWEPLEGSLVTVPADPTVGVGRGLPVKYTLRKLGDDGQVVEARKFTFDPGLNRSVEVDNDGEKEDEDDEDDDLEEGERSAEAAAVLVDPAPAPTSSAPEPSTTNPEGQRTQTMADAVVTADPAKLNEERVAGLRTLHQQYPQHFNERSLNAAIGLDLPLERAKAAIADAIIAEAQRSDVPTVSAETFGSMSERERSNYSIRNVYAAAVNVVRPGTFRDKGSEAGFEREVSETLKKKAGERGITDIGAGIVIPSAADRSLFLAQQQRAIAAGGNAGTATNFTTVMTDPIELLRFRTAVLALGARYMPGLHGAIQFPGQTGAASSSWLAEGSAVTSSDPTLGSFTMSPKRLSIANSYYRDFLAQSGLAIESFLANDRMEVLSRSLDSAAIAGSGTAPVPQGLLNWSGLPATLAGTTRASNGTVTAGAGGVPMTYVDYNNMEATIATANGDIGTMAWLTTPKVRAAGRSTPQIPGTASGFVWPNSKVGANGIQEGPLGYNALCTSNSVLTGFTANSVNNLHAAILAVWDQMLIGDWGLSEVIADPYTGAASALYKIFEHAYYDINKRHIESFVANTSILPS